MKSIMLRSPVESTLAELAGLGLFRFVLDLFLFFRYDQMEPLREINFRFVLSRRCQRQGASMLRHRVAGAARTAAVTFSFIFLFSIVALAQDGPAQDRR